LNAVFLEWMERLQKYMQVDGEYVGWAKRTQYIEIDFSYESRLCYAWRGTLYISIVFSFLILILVLILCIFSFFISFPSTFSFPLFIIFYFDVLFLFCFHPRFDFHLYLHFIFDDLFIFMILALLFFLSTLPIKLLWVCFFGFCVGNSTSLYYTIAMIIFFVSPSHFV
jgi:hypothetical protein